MNTENPKKKILVVDDEWSMQELLDEVLSEAGYDVIRASDAEEFRNLIHEEQPDVVILDIMLGDENGVEVYQEISREREINIPVIFLSALAKDRPYTPPQPNRQFSLVGKPFDLDDLVTQIKSITHQELEDKKAS